MPFGRKRAGLDSKLKLFSLDLHFAVIADVKDVLFRLYGNRVHVTDWSVPVQDGLYVCAHEHLCLCYAEVGVHDSALTQARACAIWPPDNALARSFALEKERALARFLRLSAFDAHTPHTQVHHRARWPPVWL